MKFEENTFEELLCGKFACGCGRRGAPVYLRRGEVYGELENLSRSFARGKRAALVASRRFLSERGEQTLGALCAGGAEAVKIAVSRRFDSALENIGALFSLAEDVKLIVACESELYDVAAYFSALKNLPLVYAAFSPEADGLFAPTACVKIKGKPERIFAENPRYVIVDETLLRQAEEGRVASAFASLASGVVSLIDYRVRGALTGEFCRESYHLARGAISAALGSVSKEDMPVKLLESRLIVAAAENHTLGAIARGGESAVAELLESSGKIRLSSAERKFAAALLLLDLYAAYFSSPHENLLSVPDYAARAEALSAYTGYGKGELLKGILASAALADESKLAPYAARLKEEIETLRGWAEKLAAVYLRLGGRDIFCNYSFQELKKAVCRAADLPDAFSVLTLMRESGALEHFSEL
ncbi:MAG: hypothetical protein DBX59_00580 [Bacillota bacterium]|nr:MAG: hypothetical protein DBX59_00580 [Bacillota bacterium]